MVEWGMTKDRIPLLTLLRAITLSALTLIPTVQAQYSNEVMVDGIAYSTDASPNAANGHSIALCTPYYVEQGQCIAVDDAYYAALARAEFGPYQILKADAVDQKTGQAASVLILDGGISTGLSEKLAEAIELYPDIDTLVLNSKGGNIEEAFKLYELIRKHRLNSWVPEGRVCLSACAEAFLAGEQQFITGVLGFHSSWYNWLPEMGSDREQIVDQVAKKAQGHSAMFFALRAASGMTAEFTLDIAEAGGEFLFFHSSDELNQYRAQPNCLDCVDASIFLIEPDSPEAQTRRSDQALTPDLKVQDIQVVFGTGE